MGVCSLSIAARGRRARGLMREAAHGSRMANHPIPLSGPRRVSTAQQSAIAMAGITTIFITTMATLQRSGSCCQSGPFERLLPSRIRLMGTAAAPSVEIPLKKNSRTAPFFGQSAGSTRVPYVPPQKSQ